MLNKRMRIERGLSTSFRARNMVHTKVTVTFSAMFVGVCNKTKSWWVDGGNLF